MLQNLRADPRKKPCNKNDAPAQMHGELRKMTTHLSDVCSHAEQERFEFSGTGDCSSIQKPYNGYHSQWESAND